jgi:hypothetical protein
VEGFMHKNKRIVRKINKQGISAILPTSDQLIGRGGFGVFVLYLRNVALFGIIDRKSRVCGEDVSLNKRSTFLRKN